MKRLLLLLLFAVLGQEIEAESNEKSAAFWEKVGKDELTRAIKMEQLNKNTAKNVIIFLGDGMDIATVTAARILKGQQQGNNGEETKLTMDQFQHAALSRTYSVDRQVPDSGSTATAYLGGVKTNNYMLGLTGAAEKGNCSSSKGEEKIVTSVLEEAWKVGKSSGIVTTTRINHATPGAVYSHTPDRTWYSDADLTEEAKKNGCKDIAQQFYDYSHMFKVVLGGGRGYFMPNTSFDPEYSKIANRRLDGQNLIEMWKQKNEKYGNAEYVWNKEQFERIDPSSTDYLLGMFEPKDMRYEVERNSDGSGEPSISEMTVKAIEMLQKNEEGFFLLVEGGRIDHAHHAGKAFIALNDAVAFDEAITKAVEMTSDQDTLIVVTADHGHTMSIGGYSHRGNSIFGLAPSDDEIRLGEDGKPFTTLLYGNGPGYTVDKKADCVHDRENLTEQNTGDKDYHQQAAVPLSSETHGGQDVAIFARGPMSHLFHGVHEQNYIATAIRYASCIGNYKEHCDQTLADDPAQIVDQTEEPLKSKFFGAPLSSSQAVVGLYVMLILLILLLIMLITVLWKSQKLKKMLIKQGGKLEEGHMLRDTL